MTNNKKYSLKDIKVGMQIDSKEQLSNIHDTWIILVRESKNKPYTIEFIGKETNSESDALFKQGKQICPVYNDSIELEENIFWDE